MAENHKNPLFSQSERERYRLDEGLNSDNYHVDGEERIRPTLPNGEDNPDWEEGLECYARISAELWAKPHHLHELGLHYQRYRGNKKQLIRGYKRIIKKILREHEMEVEIAEAQKLFEKYMKQADTDA